MPLKKNTPQLLAREHLPETDLELCPKLSDELTGRSRDNTHLHPLDEDLHKLLHPHSRLPHSLFFHFLCTIVSHTLASSLPARLTRRQLDGLDIVIRHVVLNPGPVEVVSVCLLRFRVASKHLCDGAVTEGAGGQGDLEGHRVLAVADVEEEPRVCGAGCESVRY